MLKKDSALGSYDHHVVRLCACLYLTQVMSGLRSNYDEKNLESPDPEEIEVHRLAKTVSEVVGISDTIQSKARKVRRAMIHFLRCAALFFHLITDIPLPTLENEDSTADDITVYAVLSEYLSLPKTLRELINHQDTFDLVHR